MKNRTSLTGPTIASALMLSVPSLLAQDWPQWRGPDRDGKVSGFKAPKTWSDQPVQKWKVTIGAGDSTPALVGERLYAFGRQDANEVILCLDPATGKPLWEERYPALHVVTGPPARHGGPRSSPAVVDGRLYALGVGGILTCLDAGNGKVVWRKESASDFLDTSNRFDTAMSPLIAEGICLVHVGGKGQGALLAFDAMRGEPKWKWDGDAPAFGSPVVMAVQGTKQVVTLTAKSIVGVGLADGKLLWQFPFEAAQGNNLTPIIDGQTVIYGGQGKGMFAVKIEPQAGGFAATPLWTNAQLGPRFTTPVLKHGFLFGYHNHFFCANAQTGATVWADSVDRGRSAALVDAGPVICAVTFNSELVFFKPNDKEYTELGRYKIADTETWAHPVVVGNRIFIRDQDSVSLWSVE